MESVVPRSAQAENVITVRVFSGVLVEKGILRSRSGVAFLHNLDPKRFFRPVVDAPRSAAFNPETMWTFVYPFSNFRLQ
jgi:hypothetical protein